MAKLKRNGSEINYPAKIVVTCTLPSGGSRGGGESAAPPPLRPFFFFFLFLLFTTEVGHVDGRYPYPIM